MALLTSTHKTTHTDPIAHQEKERGWKRKMERTMKDMDIVRRQKEIAQEQYKKKLREKMDKTKELVSE